METWTMKLKQVDSIGDKPDGIYLVRYGDAEWELHEWDIDCWYYAGMSIRKVVGAPMEPDLVYGPLPE